MGFIQKLPTQLVAAFRATLEEISEASLLLHIVDVSHPNAAAQTQAVMQVLLSCYHHEYVLNKVVLRGSVPILQTVQHDLTRCVGELCCHCMCSMPQATAVKDQQVSCQTASSSKHCLAVLCITALFGSLHPRQLVQCYSLVTACTTASISLLALRHNFCCCIAWSQMHCQLKHLDFVFFMITIMYVLPWP